MYPPERDHLGNQQIDDIALNPWTILEWAGHIFWKTAFVLFFASRADFDLGIHMINRFLENDIDLGASFMFGSGNVVQSFTAELTIINPGNMSRHYCTCICRQCAILWFSLTVGAGRSPIDVGLG